MEKIKGLEKEICLVVLVTLVGLLGFGLGRLSRLEERRVPIVIKNEAISMQEGSTPIEAGKYVASKSGNSYYLPWCTGVKRIKENNKVWFDSEDEAKTAGYAPASNCKGL
ncbi:MAG: hypothetical protein Q7S19_03120 [bacterium]|nr:hypothetical protein [bacterium]